MTEKQKVISRKEDKDFVKVYRRGFAAMGELARENGTALCVLLFLARNMDGNNAISVTQACIGEYCGLARQTVSRQLRYLEEQGWIQSGKVGANTVYFVNDRMMWTSYASQRISCRFEQTLRGSRLMFEDPWCPVGQGTKTHVRKISK